MKTSILKQLRCPFCRGELQASGIDNSVDELNYGALQCYCGQYPVLNGIPVLKKNVIGRDGKTADELVTLIKRGQETEALLSLISPGYEKFVPQSWHRLKRVPGFSRVAQRVYKRSLSLWNERAVDLLSNPQTCTACDFLEHYFANTSSVNHEYFRYRFSNGRYLVGLSLVSSLMKEPTKPILDLGCGCGTFTWVMQRQAKNCPVVGMDDSFWALCVAKSWSAPDAEFVCCSADVSLPFRDASFSTAFSLDVFHYFHFKAACIAELKRVTGQDGVVVSSWMRNALVTASLGASVYLGNPLTPAGYDALAAKMPHRLIADSEILARYLQKQGPSLAQSRDLEQLEQEPVMTLVASERQEVFKDYGTFQEWPHAQGRLALNPLYVNIKRDELGNVIFRRRFPSAHYETFNTECKSYLPEELNVHESVLKDLVRGNHTPELAKLVQSHIVIGIPERYGGPSIRNLQSFAEVTPSLPPPPDYERLNDSVMTRNMEGRINFWNRRAEEFYGWRKEEAIGRVSHDLLRTQFPKPLEEIEAELVEKGRWEGKLVHATRDGGRVVMDSQWILDLSVERGAVVEINALSTGYKMNAEQRPDETSLTDIPT